MTISKPHGLSLALTSISLLVVSACGGQTQTVTVAEPGQTSSVKTYQETPDSARQLLDDISAAVKKQMAANLGVHFTMDSLTTAAGTTVSSRGEGDMIFPDRLKMTTVNDVGGQTITVEIIVIGSQVYTNSAATGGAWKSSNTPGMAPADPGATTSYLDYTRSQRNLGKETLPNGKQVYHLEIEVDTVKSAEAAKQKVSDPALRLALDATKAATVVVDLWVGTSDQLIYQQRVRTTDAGAGLSSEQSFVYFNWGEAIEIVRPCAAC